MMLNQVDAKSLGDFGSLPPEIRNEIWRMALTVKTSITIDCCKRPFDKQQKGKSLNFARAPYLLEGYVSHTTSLTRKLGVGKALATSIIRTCCAIHNEAIAMLYHRNTFVLETALSADWFLRTIGDNVKYLTKIDTTSFSVIDDLRHLMPLTRMQAPEYVGVGSLVMRRPRYLALYGISASELAQETWNAIKPIVACREVETEVDGEELSSDVVTLTVEQQRQRLNVLYFEVDWKTRFGAAGIILDSKKRRQRFKSLVCEAWPKEISRGDKIR